MALNKVMLIGNCGADPDVKYLENGGKAAFIRLATTERYKDKKGETVEMTEWHSVSVFGKPADFVEKYVKSGSQLYVEGKIRTRSFNDKNGAKMTAVGIVADNVQLLGSRGSEKPEEKPAPTKPATINIPKVDDLPEDTDFLPF